ncbi:MAG: hypothetical protein LBT59_23800 [Clostridiales bacterium]|jgi:hypothetical protein|nr:hypothetical protein [Clostridiales bacterium]
MLKYTRLGDLTFEFGSTSKLSRQLGKEFSAALKDWGFALFNCAPEGAENGEYASPLILNAPARLKNVLDAFFPSLINDLDQIEDHRAHNTRYSMKTVIFCRILSAMLNNDSGHFWASSFCKDSLIANTNHVLGRKITSLPIWVTLCGCLSQVPGEQLRGITENISNNFFGMDWFRNQQLFVKGEIQGSFVVFLDAVVISDNNSEPIDTDDHSHVKPKESPKEKVPDTVAVDAKALIFNSTFSLATQFSEFVPDLLLDDRRTEALLCKREGSANEYLDVLSDNELDAFALRNAVKATLKSFGNLAQEQLDKDILALKAELQERIDEEDHWLAQILFISPPDEKPYIKAKAKHDTNIDALEIKLAETIGKLKYRLKNHLDKYEKVLEKDLIYLNRNLDSAIKKLEEGFCGFQTKRQKRQFELDALPAILDQLSSAYPGKSFCFVLPCLDMSVNAIKAIQAHGYHCIVMDNGARYTELAQKAFVPENRFSKDAAELSWANGLEYEGLSVNVACSRESEKSTIFVTDLSISDQDDCLRIAQTASNRFLAEKESLELQKSLGLDLTRRFSESIRVQENHCICVQIAFAISQLLLATDLDVAAEVFTERAFSEEFSKSMHRDMV